MRQWRREMEMQMARVRKEAEEKALQAQQGTMNELSALEQEAEAIKQREKEERVELLRRQIGRRMMNAGISRGWTAWNEMWLEKVRQSQLIRKAGSRLAKPALSFSYGMWKHSWEAAQVAAAMAKARAREAEAGQGTAALSQQLEKLREHYELRLASSESARKALEDQLNQLGGAMSEQERLLKEQEEKAREERVELLRRQIVRRIMNAGISRGWTAWHTLWHEKTTQRHQLLQVANRLTKPLLSQSYSFWRQDWERELHKAKQRALKQRSAELDQGAEALKIELDRVRKEYAERFEAVVKERDALREKLGVTSGDFEAKQRAQQEQLEREREQRVKHLTEMIARRILKKDLSRGWTAWHSMWEEKVTAKRKLQAAAARMKSPELANFFGVWASYSLEARQNKNDKLHAEKEAALGQTTQELTAQIAKMRTDFEVKMQLAERTEQALRAKLAEYSGGANAAQAELAEQLAREEREREQRVKHLSEMILKRILKKDLSRGWTAWHGMWEEKVTAKRKLQAAAARMKSPELANFFGVWASFSLEARQNKNDKLHAEKEASLGKGVAELTAELSRLQAESSQTISILTKERDALREQLGGSESDYAKAQKEHEKELQRQKEQRVKHLTEMIARRILKKDLSRGWTAWHGMWEEKVTAKRKLQAAAARMKAPELANFFGVWASYSLEARQNKNDKLHAEEEAYLSLQSADLKAELARMQAEYEHELEDMTRDRDRLKKKLEQTSGGLSEAEQKAAETEARQKAAEQDLAKRAAEKEAEFRLAAGSLESQLQEQAAQAEKERVQRIEHLKDMIARRMMRKDLARGWSAWAEQWDEAVQKRRQLQKAASRLRMPERSSAFKMWKDDWDATIKATQRREHEQQVAALESDSATAFAELERVRFDLQRRLDAAEASKAELMERLTALDGGAAEAELRMQEEAAADKEKRITHLCEMIARRILKKDLTRGWTAWFDLWEEKTAQKRKLQAAASRLTKPELSATFAFWHTDWESEKQKARLRAQREGHNATMMQLTEELERVRQECQAKVDAAERSRAEMLAKLSALDGGVALAEEALKAQLEQEEKDKEQRVKHLCEMIGRRILKKDLSRGWTAWMEMWEEKTVQKRKLQAAASRLRAPELASAYAHWLADWDEAKRDAERAEARKKEEAAGRTVSGLEQQLDDLRAEMEYKLHQAAREKQSALEAQLGELLGEHSAEIEKQKAEEKEARVAAMQKSMGRRMMNMDLTRGWQAWFDWWEETTYKARLMRKAGGRMGNPALSSGFAWWAKDTQMIKRAAEREANEKRKAELEDNVRKKGLEAGKLAMINTAQDDEIKALRSKVSMQSGEIDAKKQALATAEQERQAFVQLQELYKNMKETLSSAEKERDEAKRHVATQQEQSQALLTSLLNEQREKVAADLVRNENQVAALKAELKEAKEVMTGLHKEVAALKAKLPTPKKKETLQLSGKGTMPEQIAEALKSQATRVMDLFRSWDRDGDGEVSKAEFHKAIPALGIDAPKADVDELFNMWDADGGGSLAYKELKKLLSGAPPPKKKTLELSGVGPMSDQLADALKSQATRVMDLFRSWDRDGDGEVSKAEFHKAIPALGLTVPKADVDALFSQWDTDGGGALNYKELKKILSGPPSSKQNKSVAGTAKASLAAASMVSKAGNAFSGAAASAGGSPPPIALPKSPTNE